MHAGSSNHSDLIESILELTPNYIRQTSLFSFFYTPPDPSDISDWPKDSQAAIPEWVYIHLEALISLFYQKKHCQHDMQSLINALQTSITVQSDEGPVHVIPFRWNYQIILFQQAAGDFASATKQMIDFIKKITYPPICILVLYPESQPKPKIDKQVKGMPFGYRFIRYDAANPTIPVPDFGYIRSIIFGSPCLELFKAPLCEIYPSVEWVRDQLISLHIKEPKSGNQSQKPDKENCNPMTKKDFTLSFDEI